MKNVDLTRIHYLSGPFEIETAEPGDILVVEICDVQPHEAHPWYCLFLLVLCLIAKVFRGFTGL
jgi:acetamidase/formamidase